jgi:DNA modification methylase
VALWEYLIRTYTNPGDLVLDNCCGSGTTGVSALRTGRSSIQFDISQAYCDIAKSRLENDPAMTEMLFGKSPDTALCTGERNGR